MNVTIQYNTAAALAGMVLEQGQIAYAHDTQHLKIGDGVRTFAQIEVENQAKKLAWLALVGASNRLRVAWPDVGMMRYVIKERRTAAGVVSYGHLVVARINQTQYLQEYRGETAGANMVNAWGFDFAANTAPSTPSTIPYENADGSYLRYKIYDVPLILYAGIQ